MDRGDLVPDEVIVGVIAERIDSAEARDGFILDGFPRTTPQAEALDAKLEELGRAVTAVLLIDVSDDEVVRRLGGRRTCEENGHVFHVEFNPPKQEGVCDLDGSELIVRDDDKPEVIRNRLETYHEKTEPLVDYYDQRSVLRRIDGESRSGRGRARRSAAPWRRCAWSRTRPSSLPGVASVYRMIIRKTPEQVEKMAAAGRDPRPLPEDAGGEGAGRGHHRGARRGGGEVHPLPGRDAGLQGLPRLPRLDLRLAQLDGRARHPRPLRAEARRRDLDRRRRRSRTAGSPTRR